MINDVRDYLNNNIDLKYREFSSKLLPEETNILGVRLPILRSLAKKISKSNYQEYFDEYDKNCFEELMLYGMVIGNLKLPFEEITKYIDDYVSKINSWSICDSFCCSLKITNKYKEQMFEYIKKYKKSDNYKLRFMVVMFLNYYVDDNYLDEILSIIDNIKSDDYYVKMSVAWLISVIYVKNSKVIIDYLKTCKLDDFTYNKSIQKIKESYRVSKEEKSILSNMKRK